MIKRENNKNNILCINSESNNIRKDKKRDKVKEIKENKEKKSKHKDKFDLIKQAEMLINKTNK